MTARQLLSILRLSQALARIRLSGTVSHADIDEAIRLTHASKASLIEDTAAQGASSEDVMSAIYNVMRDYAVTRNSAVMCCRLPLTLSTQRCGATHSSTCWLLASVIRLKRPSPICSST